MVIKEAGLASVTGGLPGYRVVRPMEVAIDCQAWHSRYSPGSDSDLKTPCVGLRA